MKNIQVSSPETDRKVARPVSFVFMIAVWLFMAAFLTWLIYLIHTSEDNANIATYVLAGISVFVLFIIPIQLVLYFREKGTSR